MDKARISISPSRALSLAITRWDTTRSLAILTGTPSIEAQSRLAAKLRKKLHAAKFLFFHMPLQPATCRMEMELSGVLVRLKQANIAAFSMGSAFPASSFLAGVEFSNRLSASGEHLRGILLFLDQRYLNLAAFIAGYGKGGAADVPMLGAIGKGSNRFSAVNIMLRGQLQNCAVCAIAFYGENLRFSIGVESGYASCAANWIVTRARGNAILEMDERPALLRVRQTIGPLIGTSANRGGAFALGIAPREGRHQPVLRSILALDERRKSILLDHGIEEGECVSLMHASRTQISAAMTSLGSMAALRHGCEPGAFALSIAGTSRLPALCTRFDDGRHLFEKSLSPQVAHSSVRSTGILFADARSTPMFHSQTSALALIEEVDSTRLPVVNEICRHLPVREKCQVVTERDLCVVACHAD